MEGRRRQLRNAGTEAALAAPCLRRRTRFAVATARREIHGDPLHRTALPPTLQGFFHGTGRAYSDDLPRQEFGQFASLVRTPTVPVIDPSFSFIAKVLPWTDHIFLLDSRNGLLLFGHLAPDADDTPPDLGFIVCNPATEQWVAVPGCGCVDDDLSLILLTTHVSLLFDPAQSSHFHLVLFWDDLDIDGTTLTTVHTYSSEAGVWSHSENDDWSEEERQGPWEWWRRRDIFTDSSSLCGSSRALVDGLLYLILGRDRILRVDAQGKTRRVIAAPSVHVDSETYVVFVGQSQGLLHCIVEEGHEGVPSLLASDDPGMRWSYGLSVWVLQGSGTQQWTFKHRMTNQQLFGRISCRCMLDYHVVTMHPDCNLIFFVQHRDARLISYDIDRQEVRALHSFRHDFGPITLFNRLTLTPYVPYLSELFLGVIGAHKQ